MEASDTILHHHQNDHQNHQERPRIPPSLGRLIRALERNPSQTPKELGRLCHYAITLTLLL